MNDSYIYINFSLWYYMDRSQQKFIENSKFDNYLQCIKSKNKNIL